MKKQKKYFEGKSSKRKVSSLSSYSKKVLGYWHESLLKGAEIEGVLDPSRQLWEDISFDDFSVIESGQTIYRRLLKKEKDQEETQGQNKRKRFIHKPSDEVLDVVISPLRLYETYGKKRGFPLDLVLLPARLHSNGKFLPPEVDLPWIPREFLEPVFSEDCPTIGMLSDSEKFFSKHSKSNFSSFANYYAFAEKYFSYVSGCSFSEFSIDDFRKSSNVHIRVCNYSTASVNWLLRLLEESLEGRRQKGLIEKICTKDTVRRRLYKNSKKSIYDFSKKHLAHLTPQYPLAPSQRLALHRFLETPEGEIFCVNGPPGTGKTTVLQSFVATQWVLSALTKGGSPPISLVCGATNQSVLNVINAFEGRTFGDSAEEDSFLTRWLPRVHSHGSFLSSFSKFEDAKEYQVERADGKGFSSIMEEPAYVYEAEQYFLRKYQEHFPKVKNSAAAVDKLHLELKKNVKDLSQALISSLDMSFLDILLGSFKNCTEAEVKRCFEALAAFDTTVRYKLFHLASHYWEARWLCEVKEELTLRQSKDDIGQRLRSSLEDWRRRAMITPVFVSTLSMAGRFFGVRELRDTTPLDVLYFDEAGQVSPEFAAPLATLAKKMVVIGDTAQLAPYTNILPHVDEAMMLDAELVSGKKESEFRKLVQQGMSVSSSNLMERAVACCEREDGRIIGSLLQEHRRSVPEIVSFCNDLSYNGRLIPMRKPLEGRMIPTFTFFEGKGVSEKVGQSRRNIEEAKAISIFLKSMNERFSKYYNGKPLDQILAVLTPFTAQARELEKNLRKQWPNLIIGTVHSLQGAERELIVFSSVYDATHEGVYAFDLDKRILNVAVSRAKDSFIVFGNSSTFLRKDEEQAPRLLLGDYLFPRQELR